MKKIWLKYLQVYEDFNKNIPKELKKLFSEIRQIIGVKTESFSQTIDLKKLNFFDNLLQINVEYTKLENNKDYSEKDIIYYSNININDLLNNEKIIKLPIFITDVNLNIDKLVSLISHEIRHIYDIYTINEESDMFSFIKSLYYSILIKDETNIYFTQFLNLIYLSLEHELIARNTMIYENFINCKCSKEELNKAFEKTFIYKSFEKLNNFNYDDLIKQTDIINKTNIFIDYFGGDLCNNETDIINFYKKWQIYFKEKSKEYNQESQKILNDIYNVIKENNSVLDEPLKVKQLLLKIYNEYIK